MVERLEFRHNTPLSLRLSNQQVQEQYKTKGNKMKTAEDILYVIPFQRMEQIKAYTMQCLKLKRTIPSSYCESRIFLLGNRLSVLVVKDDFNSLIKDIERLLNFNIDINTFIDTSMDVLKNVSKLQIKTIKDRSKWIRKPFPFIDDDGNQAYIKLDDKRFYTVPLRQNIKEERK